MPHTPHPSGTSHGPALGAARDQLVVPGKGFSLVALGERAMGQTRACCHVPSRHRWFQSRSQSVAWVAGGGHELGFAANSCRWLVGGPAPSLQQSRSSLILCQKKALFPPGESLHADPTIPILYLPTTTYLSFVPIPVSSPKPLNPEIPHTSSGGAWRGGRAPQGAPLCPAPAGCSYKWLRHRCGTWVGLPRTLARAKEAAWGHQPRALHLLL